MLRNLLRSHLVRSLVLVVDPAEVGHDDGHRQGDHQHTAERADGAEDLPRDGVGNHVAVPAGRKHTISQPADQHSSNIHLHDLQLLPEYPKTSQGLMGYVVGS